MNKIFCIVVLLVFLVGCRDYDYYQDVKSELDSGIRNDSLFMGYYFGMPRQDFYDYSWSLNKKQLVKQGEFNQSIEYEFDYDGDVVRMNFFPSFKEDVIRQMTVSYSHLAWSPWTKNLWSDKLIVKVKDIIEERDKVDFELLKDKYGTPAFVGISGNQRIVISIKDDELVMVDYTDMSSIDNPLDSLIFVKKYE